MLRGVLGDSFFDHWVYDSFYPVYEYNYLNDECLGKPFVSLKQTQELSGRRPLFEMPVQVKLFLQNGNDTLITLWNDMKGQTIELEIESAITSVQFDPDGCLLDVANYEPELPVVLAETGVQTQLRISPTLAGSFVDVNLPGLSENAQMFIYDINGKKVFHGELHQMQSRIDISGFVPELYIIKLVNAEKVLSAKFVKQ